LQSKRNQQKGLKDDAINEDIEKNGEKAILEDILLSPLAILLLNRSHQRHSSKKDCGKITESSGTQTTTFHFPLL